MEKSNDVARGEAMGKPRGNEQFREKKEARQLITENERKRQAKSKL